MYGSGKFQGHIFHSIFFGLETYSARNLKETNSNKWRWCTFLSLFHTGVLFHRNYKNGQKYLITSTHDIRRISTWREQLRGFQYFQQIEHTFAFTKLKWKVASWKFVKDQFWYKLIRQVPKLRMIIDSAFEFCFRPNKTSFA